ncbi:unnamed protein product, partial [Mesorhabditis spiculigera]
MPLARCSPANFQESLQVSKFMALAGHTLLMLLSIGLLGFAIQVLVEYGYSSPISGTNSLNYSAGLALLVGILSFASAPLGFYATIIHDANLLKAHMMIVCVLSMFCIASLGLGYVMQNEILSGYVKTWANESLQSEYGHPDNKQATEAWDSMQRQLACCGMSEEGPKDYRTSAWLLSQIEYPRRLVPESCCPTCGTIHEKFCYQFLLDKVSVENATLLEKVCILAAQKCDRSSEIFPDPEVCTGRRALPGMVPADAYRHQQGCYEQFEHDLLAHAQRLSIFATIFAIILIINFTLTFR